MNFNNKKNNGEPFVWLSSLGLAVGLMMIIGILSLIAIEGVSVFWPRDIVGIKLTKKSKSKIKGKTFFAGEKILEQEKTINKISLVTINGKKQPKKQTVKVKEIQFYVANRDVYGFSFHYIDKDDILNFSKPKNIMMIDRSHNSRAIVIPQKLIINNKHITYKNALFKQKLKQTIKKLAKLSKKSAEISRNELNKINNNIKKLSIKAYTKTQKINNNFNLKNKLAKYLALESKLAHRFPDLNNFLKDIKKIPPSFERQLQQLIQEKQKLSLLKNNAILELLKIHDNIYKQNEKSLQAIEKIQKLKKLITQDKLIAKTATGEKLNLNIGHIASYYFPNQLSTWGKLKVFASNIQTFLFDKPREANTQGGVFPAIVGTFLMTILMSIAVTPLGVITAIYLKEYARQGFLTRTIRIMINNLAGIPSIVFGAFGLGFFIYVLGYNIDKLFFADHVNSGAGPVFGTGGLLWCSLTLALMTLPVVIVASEEALNTIGRGVREGALGCGASKWQMIRTIILPAARPGIITGVILAMARGAGEVAPLMLVGVVKVAPHLLIDNIYPYIHLDHKFMHLGFHIYDLGFQSPDSEATKPMVFATTLLLISIVCILNLIGILTRQHLKKKYSTGNF